MQVRRVLCGVVLGLAASWVLPVQAQRGGKKPTPAASKKPAKQAGEGGDDETTKAPKVKVERGAGGKKVYRIETGLVIEGRIQKPNAFYVLQRSQINYDWAKLKQDFVPRIVDSVRSSPF